PNSAPLGWHERRRVLPQAQELSPWRLRKPRPLSSQSCPTVKSRCGSWTAVETRLQRGFIHPRSEPLAHRMREDPRDPSLQQPFNRPGTERYFNVF
ncbi:unnamed protein product, partial [Symbiodinium microadriaticum]